MSSVPGDEKLPNSWSAPGSAQRNAGPITEALTPYLSSFTVPKPVILEVASGFGRQIRAVAASAPHCVFQPSELDKDLCAEVNKSTSSLENVLSAETLDVTDQSDWMALVHNVSASLDKTATPGSDEVDALFHGVLACNLTHIAPWKVTQNLFSHLDPRLTYITNKGQCSLLSPTQGWIALYGAFNENGTFTSPGNKQFDADIRARNPEYGLRDIQSEILPLAQTHGYRLAQRIEMPAGNLLLLFTLEQ